LQQEQHVVIGGCPVHSQPAAPGAAVYQHPLAFAANGDGYRLHAPGALSLPVTGDVAIKMPGPEAAGTVVAVRRAGGVQRDVYAAVSALERARKRQVWRPFRAGSLSWADISPPLALVLTEPPSSGAAGGTSTRFARQCDLRLSGATLPSGRRSRRRQQHECAVVRSLEVQDRPLGRAIPGVMLLDGLEQLLPAKPGVP
jgi:hypothetical protein